MATPPKPSSPPSSWAKARRSRSWTAAASPTPSWCATCWRRASARGVKTQREVLPFGGTDASAIQLSRGGVIAGTVSIPCRYVHSACEVIDLRDVEAARALLLEYLK